MNFFKSINKAVADSVNTPAIATLLALVVRILLAAIFVLAGSSKIGGYEATQGYMQAMGVPGFPLEVGGGLALIVGFQTRLAALGLAVFCIIAAFIFHHGADQISQIMFMKNFAMAGGLLALTLHGAGRASLDGEASR